MYTTEEENIQNALAKQRQKFKEFVEELKIRLRDKYSDKRCLYETAIITGKIFEEIDNLYKKYSKDNSPQSGFEPVKGEWNNSPEDTQKDNHSPQEISSNKDFSQQNRRFIEPEDTQNDLCECGHEKEWHYNKQTPTGKIFMCAHFDNKYCGCKEFKPQDIKGCGKWYIDKNGFPILCGKGQLCPACSKKEVEDER